jgi:hypothetical protein
MCNRRTFIIACMAAFCNPVGKKETRFLPDRKEGRLDEFKIICYENK